MTYRAAFACLLLLAAGCASEPRQPPVPRDRAVLLPGSDGTTGALTVRQGGREVVLDSPYAAAAAGSDGTLQAGQADAAATRAEFASALQALPPAAASFVAYFVFGQDELTEESRKAIVPLLEEVARRPAPEITVTGHTDQVGAEHVNEALSLRRAERVKEMLVQRGVSAGRIVAAGRGSREPLVRTAEGVSEARNRRVEISVR